MQRISISTSKFRTILWKLQQFSIFIHSWYSLTCMQNCTAILFPFLKEIIHSGCQWSCNFFVPKEMIEICYFIHQIHLLSNLIKERMNNFEEQILQIIMTAILIIFLSFFLLLWSSNLFQMLSKKEILNDPLNLLGVLGCPNVSNKSIKVDGL